MFFLKLPFTVEESTWLWLAISHHLQRGYHSHLTLPPVFTQIDCERKIIKIIYNPYNVVTHLRHHQTPPTARAESLVLLTHTVVQASALVRRPGDTMTPVKQNHIHCHIPTPFRIISFMISDTDMKYDLQMKNIL